MIATSPPPAETTPFSLNIRPDFSSGGFVTLYIVGLQTSFAVSKLVQDPAFRLSLLTKPWALGAVVLGIVFVIGALIYNGYLAIPASRITLVEDGLEVQTRRGSRVIPYRAVRRITKESRPPIYRIGFENYRIIRYVKGDDAREFMTELSARSGVEIKQ